MDQRTPELSALFQPRSVANLRLREKVAPEGWTNPSPDGRYNLVVIGAGTGGLVAAAGAAGLGARVALIERHALGGDCLNVGCVPSKALLAAAKRFAAGRRAKEYGLLGGEGLQVDFSAVMERMRELRADIGSNDAAQRFSDMGIDVYLGDARFTDGSTVEVQGVELSFAKAIVATGARAALPSIEGLEEAKPLTNETVFSLTELPRRLVIIGGGPIGCELAQAFARLGSKVTVLQSRGRILPHDDEDAAAVVQAALVQDGIDIICGASVQEVKAGGDASSVEFEQDGARRSAECDRILVAAGRAPNVENLGLEAAGVKFDAREGIEVDERLRTTNKRIFAVGDVCLRYKFTHTADASARIAIQNALFMGRKKRSDLLVPWCTYTEPELAHVGLSEKQSRDAHGDDLQVFKQDFAEVDRSIVEGQTEGFAKVYAVKGRIVGATIVGHGAGDLISELSVAMQSGMKLGELGSVIHPYPTSAGAIKKIGDAYTRTRLTPLIKNLFTKWLAWRR